MRQYEAPTLTVVGTLAGLTQGQAFHPGSDNLAWVPVFGPLFGGDDYTGPGFGS